MKICSDIRRRAFPELCSGMGPRLELSIGAQGARGRVVGALRRFLRRIGFRPSAPIFGARCSSLPAEPLAGAAATSRRPCAVGAGPAGLLGPAAGLQPLQLTMGIPATLQVFRESQEATRDALEVLATLCESFVSF